MPENKLVDLSTDFAVQILKLTDTIKGHYALTNQLERSATSIGANIREARYAHSRPDFIAKLQIALKECYETEYWLELLAKSQILDPTAVTPSIPAAVPSAVCSSHPSIPQKPTPVSKHVIP